MGRVIDVTLGAAGASPCRPGSGIDTHPLHRRQVNDYPIVDTSKPRPVVASAADGDEEVVVAPEIHRRDHIGHVGTAGNNARPLVDHTVIERALPRNSGRWAR